MSVISCQHCDTYIDTDYDVEHEDMCKLEQEDMERKSEEWNKRRKT